MLIFVKIYPKRSYKENGKNSEENFAKKNHDLTFFFINLS